MTADHIEEQWVVEQRTIVVEYLAKGRVDHLGVGEWPAFMVPPHFAIWAVQSKRQPGFVGWWAFCGDIPTDYVSRESRDDPRLALGRLLDRWRSYLPFLVKGDNPPGIELGSSAGRRSLGELLQTRIALLDQWFGDDGIWADVLDA